MDQLVTISDDFNGLSVELFPTELVSEMCAKLPAVLKNSKKLGTNYKSNLSARKISYKTILESIVLSNDSSEYPWSDKLQKIKNLKEDLKIQNIVIDLLDPKVLENNFCINGISIPSAFVMAYLSGFHLKNKDLLIFKIPDVKNEQEAEFWGNLFSNIESFIGLPKNSIQIKTEKTTSVIYNLSEALINKSTNQELLLCGA